MFEVQSHIPYVIHVAHDGVIVISGEMQRRTVGTTIRVAIGPVGQEHGVVQGQNGLVRLENQVAGKDIADGDGIAFAGTHVGKVNFGDGIHLDGDDFERVHHRASRGERSGHQIGARRGDRNRLRGGAGAPKVSVGLAGGQHGDGIVTKIDGIRYRFAVEHRHQLRCRFAASRRRGDGHGICRGLLRRDRESGRRVAGAPKVSRLVGEASHGADTVQSRFGGSVKSTLVVMDYPSA